MTNQKIEVANPKLTLYAFHLRNDLSLGLQTPVENANDLWLQCKLLGEKLNIEELKDFSNKLNSNQDASDSLTSQYNQNSDYLELLPERLLHFSTQSDENKAQLTGEIYPLQIHDTYAVDITLRYANTTVSVDDLKGLNPDAFLLPNQINASLGQTLILFAQPIGTTEYQELAKNCLKALLPETETEKVLNFPLIEGKFLGSPIFKYENYPENYQKNLHVLIWFNCSPRTETSEAEGQYYQLLVNLLCCRSKVLYAYSESHWCNEQGRIIYQDLKDIVKELDKLPGNLDKRLQKLKKLLTEMTHRAFNYGRHLRDLEIHRTTIETNVKNYKYWLLRLQKISDEDNLDFFQDFLDRTNNKFVKQIRVYLAYLTPGEHLFGEILDSIRGMVQIAQSESDRQIDRDDRKRYNDRKDADTMRDRNLQTTIATVGFGLGAAQIGASVAPYIISQQSVEPIVPPFTTNKLHPSVLSVLLSLGFGIIGAIIPWVISNRSEIARWIIKAFKSSSDNQPLLRTSNQALPDKQNHNQ
jgi:hypothetical protein